MNSGAWLNPDMIVAAGARAASSIKKKDRKRLDGLVYLAFAVVEAVPDNSRDYRVFVSAIDFLLIKDFFNREEPT